MQVWSVEKFDAYNLMRLMLRSVNCPMRHAPYADRYVGLWCLAARRGDGRLKVVVSKEDGRLCAVLSYPSGAAWPKAKLSPFGRHQFGTRDLIDYEIEFTLAEGGKAGALKIWQGGPRFTLDRIEK